MKINKIPLLIVSITLISLGWYQEIYYYRFTFTSIGLDIVTSTIAGVSLSILLSYFAYQKKIIGFVVLITFSIGVTIIGQNQSYAVKEQAYTTDTLANTGLTELKNRYTLEIERINTEIDYNNSLLPDSVQSRAVWKTNGVEPIERKIADLKAEKKEYEQLLTDTINKLSTRVYQPTLFENIASDIPFMSAVVLKYVFMSFMSLFIALMAPAGVTLYVQNLSTSKPVEKKRVQKQEKTTTPKQDKISIYTECRFNGEDKPDILKSRKYIVDNSVLTNTEVNKLNKRAETLGLVVVKGNKTIPVVGKSQFELLLRNGQRAGNIKQGVM